MRLLGTGMWFMGALATFGWAGQARKAGRETRLALAAQIVGGAAFIAVFLLPLIRRPC
jgi:hypothetical protein